MSELSSHHESPEADIVDLEQARRAREVYIDPDQVTDEEAVALFMSQISHAGAPHEPDGLARYVRKLLGDSQDDNLTEEQLAWRARILQTMIDVDDLDVDQLDEWLQQDEVLREMYDVLRNHQHARERTEERKALMQLRHLRGGVLHRHEAHEDDDERWLRLVHKLGHQALQ